MTHETREQWLSAAVNELRPLFQMANKPLPQNIRVTCGFPSNARRSGAIGECWADTASADKHFEILISPTQDNPRRVFDVLVHELCHATDGAMNHGINFQKAAALMHLQPANTSGKQAWKATVPASTFDEAYNDIIGSLGAYPHAALSMTERKVQGTRMLKAFCPTCGYTVRLTQRWATLGLPTCPIDGDLFTL